MANPFNPTGPKPAGVTFNPEFTIRPLRRTTAQLATLEGDLDADDEGLMVYDTDLEQHFRWSGTEFQPFVKVATEQSFNLRFY